MINGFSDVLQKIDNNIKTLDNSFFSKEEGVNLLKETTQLLSTGSTLLTNYIKNNTETKILMERDKLDLCYKDLISRKKILFNITRKFQEDFLGLNSNNSNTNINFNTNDEDENYNFNYNQSKPIELELLTDYNEKLLSSAIRNINEASQNIKETSKNSKNEGNKLNDLYYKTGRNHHKTKIGSNYIDSISIGKKCRAISLIAINLLLFLSIIILIIFKFF